MLINKMGKSFSHERNMRKLMFVEGFSDIRQRIRPLRAKLYIQPAKSVEGPEYGEIEMAF